MSYQLKELPVLLPTQSWCCSNGSGTTSPRMENFEYSREEAKDGKQLDSKSVPVWQSACCSAGLFLYDEAIGESTEWDN